jgi:hypothetical protein
MRNNTQRLAWAVLAVSFAVCIVTAVAVPALIRLYVIRATEPDHVTLEVQRGPLRATLAGRGIPVAVAQNREDVPEGTVVATDSTAGQLVLRVPDADTLVARVQLYDDTEVVLVRAKSPRFAASDLPHSVVLDVNVGRVRINVADEAERPTEVLVRTPRGNAWLSHGSYEVKVNGTSMAITVRSGRAVVDSPVGASLALGPAERGVVGADGIDGPLQGARSLVLNGDFQQPLEPAWSVYDAQTDPEQPRASAEIVADQERRVVRFLREGVNHAEIGLVQEIGYDVRDFTLLELRLGVNVVSQNIAGFGGCGFLSSECPVMVVVEFRDIHGIDHEWRHGFYTGEPAEGWPVYPWTEQIPAGTWHSYESGNLMGVFSETPPAIVQSVTIYASGHSFDAMVTEVELLAQE